ncbi:uncharacterized protein LOC135817492 [Sycon ciliatum]|uniref:uncharacterized protein LOC135817492 n=1 Tax=Sycon ciliatum TaxID=27933 RepID=UPI0031F5F476
MSGFPLATVLPLLLLATAASSTESYGAGFSVRITEKGFQYAAETLIPEAVRAAMRGLQIPSVIPVEKSGFEVQIINATLQPLVIHTLSIKPHSSPSSVEVQINVDVRGSTHFHSLYKRFFLNVEDHGLIDFAINDVSISFSNNLARGPEGEWRLVLISHKSSVSSVDFQFKNVLHPDLLKFLSPVLKYEIRLEIESILKSLFPTFVVRANEEMATYLPLLPIKDGLGLNLGLTSDVQFSDNCFSNILMNGLVTYNNISYGKVRNLNVVKPLCNEEMMSGVVSISTAESLLLALSQPDDKFHYKLETGVFANNSMLAIVFPEIEKHALTGELLASVSLSKGGVTFGDDRLDLSLTGEIDVIATSPHSEKEIVAASLLVTFRAGSDVNLVNLSKPVNGSVQSLTAGNITLDVESVELVSSAIGPVKTNLIREMLRGAALQHMPDLEKIGREGILLPTAAFGTPVFHLKITPGHIRLAVDMQPPKTMDGIKHLFNKLGVTKWLNELVNDATKHGLPTSLAANNAPVRSAGQHVL